MNKSDIYYFRINRESSKIYFKLYDYKEIKIKRILCYYNIKSEYIIFLYQSSMYIKYFSLINNNNIHNINSSNSKIFELKSNEEIEYDINELLEISKIGHLNIDQVIINKNGKSYTENFAINFFQLLVNNNKLVIGKNYKNWYNYSLSLFEHIENNYTRIYHLNQIIIIVKTCFSNKCQTCNKDYYKCDFIEKPAEYYQDPDSCFGIFNNKCYPRCPEGTCLNQDDIELINCIPIEENITVLNYICFRDLEELKNNIKYISEIDEPIMTRPDIIIKGYSTNSIYEKIQNNANYSIINLGECVNKLKIYYNLSNDTELYIFGVDSPSKNKSYITSVYNYEVLLENGTQIDHYKVCKDNKITVSSLIRNTSLAKLDEAIYFSEFGYDIYNKSSRFYTDNCAPASINGNDITLEDRIREFYPSNISICNESCYYISVNFTSKRFICECELEYNFSLNYINVNNNEEEEDTTYFDYFLSLINYKITVCYALFFDFKSYYYNAGFYIAFGTLVFCIIGMIIFLKYGIADLNKIFLENIPNKMKLIKSFKEQEAKRKELIELQIEFEINCNNINNPIKKNKLEEKKNFEGDNIDILDDNESEIKEEININHKNENDEINYEKKSDNETNIKYLENEDIKPKRHKIKWKKKKKIKKFEIEKKQIECLTKNISGIKINKYSNNSKIRNRIYRKESHQYLRKDTKANVFNNKNKTIYYKKNSIINNFYNIANYTIDKQVDKKELNEIPYSQALRIDDRNYFEMLLSVLANEINIISIFYYRNPYNHLSITLSIYIFELCLDLTLNCFLYTDDVVSQKYHNDGSIEFFTSLSLSFMSNIFACIITFIVGKLADYGDSLQFILKDNTKKDEYFLNIIKFRKYLILKLTGFYIIQMIFNFFMCYYLMIFCTVYHKTQGSIMINYIVGVAESISISLGLAIITSLIRFLSIKYKTSSCDNP